MSPPYPRLHITFPGGQYLYMARAMKERVSVPVIGCNRLDLHKGCGGHPKQGL